MMVYCVRHGESTANVENVISNRGFQHPLTDKGQIQAQTLAQTLKDESINHIYTSPLQRAVQTANIIAQPHQLKPQTHDALREFDCGIAEGKSDAQSWQTLRDVWAAWRNNHLDARIQGGESYNDILARFIPFMNQLAQQHPPESQLILVAHGGVFMTALPELLININHEYTMSKPIGNAQYIKAQQTPQGWICLEWCGYSLT